MKLYRNDNDHYSILVPNDFEYQDISKISEPQLQGISLLAVAESSGIIYIQQFQQLIYRPIENWSSNEIENFFLGIKQSQISKFASFEDSGEIDIHNNKFLWIKFKDSTKSTLLYSTVHNNVLYSIGYIYPSENREKIISKINESINSLKFDDIHPNWYWIDSNNVASTYIDTNSITSYKDISTNSYIKNVTVKITSQMFNSDGYSHVKGILEFKEENGHRHYRILSLATYDENDNFIKYIFNLMNLKNDPSFDRWWIDTSKDIQYKKISDLLFEKNQ
ncbi:hypothetical protein [Anaerosinus massiliensis]|uniref:hypothetical protein n=1 Tax=Massilibacillus massiliensis TaxID=1806837 RepID=UPI0018FE176C|nr:hypothetical protein [Massilibacillus massiliensis]